MPTPAQIRYERIEELQKWAQKINNEINEVTPIYREVLARFPMIGEITAMSYARSVLRMLKQERTKKEAT